MKFSSQITALALAGLMACSATACGAMQNTAQSADPDAESPLHWSSGRVYRYSPMPDNKGNVRQDVTGLTRRERLGEDNRVSKDLMDAGKDAGRDLKRAGRDLSDGMRRAGDEISDRAKNAMGEESRNDSVQKQLQRDADQRMPRSGVSLNGMY